MPTAPPTAPVSVSSEAWRVVRATALGVLTVTVLLALGRIASVLALVFVGAFVAVGIEPLVRGLVARGVRRGFALLLLALGLLAAIAAVTSTVAVPVARQVPKLVDRVPEVLGAWGNTLGSEETQRWLAEPEVQERVSAALGLLTESLDGLMGSLFGAVGGVLGFLLSAATVTVVAVYFSLAMPRLRSNARALLRDDEKAALLDEVLGKVGSYVMGQALVCVCAGVVSFIALSLLGVPYAAVLAVLVLLLDAIPQVGAFLGAILAVAVALTESIGTAVAVAGFFALYQVVENYLVAPRVFSSVINLSPLVSFLAILLGAALAGVLGAVAALPLTAAATTLARHWYAQRRPEDGLAPVTAGGTT